MNMQSNMLGFEMRSTYKANSSSHMEVYINLELSYGDGIDWTNLILDHFGVALSLIIRGQLSYTLLCTQGVWYSLVHSSTREGSTLPGSSILKLLSLQIHPLGFHAHNTCQTA